MQFDWRLQGGMRLISFPALKWFCCVENRVRSRICACLAWTCASTTDNPQVLVPVVFGKLVDDGVILTDRTIGFRCFEEFVFCRKRVDRE